MANDQQEAQIMVFIAKVTDLIVTLLKKNFAAMDVAEYRGYCKALGDLGEALWESDGGANKG